MTLYALDDVEDAIQATKDFLLPFDLATWTKLAIVVFFLGSASGANPFQFTGSIGSVPGSVEETPSVTVDSLTGTELAIVGAIVAAIIVIGILFAIISSIMEFVFFESLRGERVRLRRYWSDRWRQGIRLFGFRLLVGVVLFVLAGAVVLLALSPFLLGGGGFSLALLLLALPVLFAIVVIGAVVYSFTTMFVVPVMILEDCGVFPAWRRFWPTMIGQWKQYLVYAVVLLVINLAIGVVMGFVMLAAVIVLAIPLGLVGLAGFLILSVSTIAGALVIALAVLAFVLGLIGVALYASVPLQSFVRYHALLVLGDTDREFDLIPARRQSIRE